MDTPLTDEELDRWFDEVVTKGGTRTVDDYVRVHYDLPGGFEKYSDPAIANPALDRFADAWLYARPDDGSGHIMGGRVDEDWHRLSTEAKRALRAAHDVQVAGERAREAAEEDAGSIVDELGGSSTGGRRLQLPLIVGGVVLVLAVVVGSGAFRDDGTVSDAPTAAEGAGDEPTGEAPDGEPTSSLPPARPATDEPVTVTFTGDDACSLGAGLAELGINIAPGPGPQGGQIGFFGPAGPDPFAMTGTLMPGPDGPVWNDRGDDAQLFTDVTVADGAIAGDLAWTDESGCTSTLDLVIGVPAEVTAWWELLPPFAPADAAFTGTLTVTDGVATLTGTLLDTAGNPVEGAPLTLQVRSEDGLGEAIATVSGPGGLVQLTFTAPGGDVLSVSVQVAKGAHDVGNVFATNGG